MSLVQPIRSHLLRTLWNTSLQSVHLVNFDSPMKTGYVALIAVVWPRRRTIMAVSAAVMVKDTSRTALPAGI